MCPPIAISGVGGVIASLSCEAISLGDVILRDEGSELAKDKILRFAQNDG